MIPLGQELKDMYENPEMGHSLRALKMESVQPQMNMSEITYVSIFYKQKSFLELKYVTLPSISTLQHNKDTHI